MNTNDLITLIAGGMILFVVGYFLYKNYQLEKKMHDN
jgi:hypothetical protein